MTNSDTLRLIATHISDDVAQLALQLQGHPDAEFILRQVEGRQVMARKVPAWAKVDDIHYPRRISLEQCSGESAARYKADLARRLLPGGGTFADITGGLGVDFSFIAKHFRRAVYVERQAELCELARHNFPLLGLPDAEVVNDDGVEVFTKMDEVDLLFVDPARRDGQGRKVVMLSDCEPNVVELNRLLLSKARFTILKLSPMLDIHAALQQLEGVCEVHVVAERNECKDLLLVMNRSGRQAPVVFCHDENVDIQFLSEEEKNIQPEYADSVETYLYEPGVTLLKAAAYNLPCQRYGVKKLHPNSHLYTSQELVPDFPGRTFRVVEQHDYKKKQISNLSGSKANLAVRNFPDSVAQLRKRLKIKDGGEEYWFATTLKQGEKVIVRTKKAKKL